MPTPVKNPGEAVNEHEELKLFELEYVIIDVNEFEINILKWISSSVISQHF